MIEFFMNNSLYLFFYLLVITLLVFSITQKKFKGYILLLALVLYVVDISFLLVNGFNLLRCAIISGICVILVLISIREGRDYEF